MRAICFYMESKPLEGVDVFAWFTHPFIFSFSLSPWKRTGTEREENTQGNCSGHCSTPMVYTAVAPLTSVFPVSGIAQGSQQCNSAENGLLETPGTFMYALRSPRRSKGTMRAQKELDGGGGGRSMHNLQGKAGGIVLVWFREEKAAVRDRAMDFL